MLYVTGFFYKIVPLLAWTARFRGRVGREPVPTVAELYSSRVAQVQFVVMVAGVTLLGGGIGGGSVPVTRCGAALFLGGIVMFMSQIGRVAMGGARMADGSEFRGGGKRPRERRARAGRRRW